MRLAGGMGHVPVPDPDLYDLGHDDGTAEEENPDPQWANNASYMKGFEDGHMAERPMVQEQTGESAVDNNTHHWPRVAWDDVGELVDKWTNQERKAFDKGDPVMMGMGDTYNESKGIWDMQVEQAGMDMENELIKRVRQIALQTMQEFTDKLIDGEYA